MPAPPSLLGASAVMHPVLEGDGSAQLRIIGMALNGLNIVYMTGSGTQLAEQVQAGDTAAARPSAWQFAPAVRALAGAGAPR
jgi:hypothetical protein